MDKKYTLIGILFLLAAVGLMFRNTTAPQPAQRPPTEQAPDPSGAPPPRPEQIPSVGNPPPGQVPPVEAAAAPTPAAAAAAPSSAAAPWINGMFAPVAPTPGDEQVTTLENEFIEVRLTNYGGAVSSIALKQHRKTKEGDDPLVLNDVHHAPILAFSSYGGADFATRYELVSADSRAVVFRTVAPGQLEITRTYRISRDEEQQDPYVIRSETTLRNLTTDTINLPARFAINLGTGVLVHDSDDPHMLTVGRYDGDDLEQSLRTALDQSSGFLGMFGARPAIPYLEDPGPTTWATVENQFFATVVTGETPGTGVSLRRIELPPANGNLRPRYGLVGEMLLPSRAIAPQAVESLNFDVYAGPKEYKRLVRFGQEQDKVMGWGNILGGIAKILLLLLTSIHGMVGNWGIAIVLTTITLRIILWPLTGIQTRAAKRMAKISGPLKELQEKYKDNRQKLTEETMKLWKVHKVNPVAGCMPLLVQMPIFIGLFYMLRSASELRFAEFLWVKDLSSPDTIATLPLGFMDLPINVMVLLWGVSTHIQMRLSPTPSTDNMQMKIMKFMPVMMVVFCYTFSSGLSLYWTASNLFTIFQQWVTNRSKDPVETLPPAKAGAADRAKPVRDAKVSNVRDGKKKKR